MTKITLKHLRYFEAVALHRHFGHAAEACAISQPALSVQIKELEQILQTTLFERGTRNTSLTSFGAEFAPRARAILQGVDELQDMARAAKQGIVGRLRIGIIPTIAPYLLPDIITKLMRTNPDIDIQVRETLTSHLINELADGRIDAAIVALPVSEPAFTEVALFEEKFVLVRPEADRDKPTPDRARLTEMKLLLLEEGHCFRDQALSFCDIQSDKAREALDASSLSTLVQMVGAGIGVTLIPEIAVAVETQSARVAVCSFPEPQPTRTVGMIWRKTNPLSAKLLGIADLIRAA
ncbi:MAG: hydrogen peroxide-inducible genes activator [Sulfitobacter sp.]|jgi:LysR family transcriptional regulator, hydrogen peroxide-inducible genes activator|uniref:hydrogen peroxide-inducible genes activator n=1 Tax=Sulfitobacter sp. TaxID=1903071 RepID=UPI000C11A838|nr:LysR family transcriptional regulator [Roseobacter sp.]PHR04963.1 MAG: LysR family transcriptional regulator [Sulfitobacter sp.]|tara:strand:- start:13432 stop:14313 length:882 start_codon:yes stop_codon:yes gene_type:complete